MTRPGGADRQARAKRFVNTTRDAGRPGVPERKRRDQDAAIERADAENDRLRADLAEMKATADKKSRRLVAAEA